jgi:hypothetical protein
MKFWPVCVLVVLTACVGDVGPSAGPGSASPGGRPASPGQPGGGATPSTGGMSPGPGMPIPPPPPLAERPPAAAIVTTRFARLSHRQWENTVRDLLRLPDAPGLAAKFSSDTAGKFANDGEALAVSDNLRADYQTAAETLAARVARDPAALARLLPGNVPADAKARARAFITEFGRRAFRRPLDDQEVAAYAALFDQGPTLVGGTDSFAAGAQLVLEGMLQSHHFLYRTELTTGTGRVRLSEYEIAAKLSYALAGTMPDDQLFQAAAGGGLNSTERVGDQVQRLLGRGSEPSATFHEELFDLRALEVEKDPKAFPGFGPTWQASIIKESNLFLADMFASGKGLTELLTEPVTFVDGILAPLYGVKAPPAGTPAGFARVELDRSQRAGFLTQIAFLAKDGLTDPEPIRRGAFINHALLCLELVPPPGATDEAPDPPASARTNRERVTAVTSGAACEACHKTMINPAGFAFENYDAIGRYRTTENGVPIDASDTYSFASGPKRFTNAIEWSRVLADSPEAHDCYARNWFSFLQGRGVKPEDETFVKWLAERSLRDRASLKSLAMIVVTDDSFLTRLP